MARMRRYSTIGFTDARHSCIAGCGATFRIRLQLISNNPIAPTAVTILENVRSVMSQGSIYTYYIKNIAITYGIGEATVEEIDNINILNATMKAMLRAVDEAYKKHPFDKLLIDGPYFKGYTPPGVDSELLEYECIPKGDMHYLSIAAASIIAKDYHTKLINDLVVKHPELNLYEIKKNKGYGTAKHIEVINKQGITNLHRKTFGICKYK